jgi:hypothetical protein
MEIDPNRAGLNNLPPRDLTRLALPLVIVFCGLMIFLLGWALLANRYGWTGFSSSLLGLTMLGAGTVLLMVRVKALTLRLAMILPLLAVASCTALLVLLYFKVREPNDTLILGELGLWLAAFASFSMGMLWFVKEAGMRKVVNAWNASLGSVPLVVLVFWLEAGTAPPMLGFLALIVMLCLFCIALLRTARVLREADQQLKEGKA